MEPEVNEQAQDAPQLWNLLANMQQQLQALQAQVQQPQPQPQIAHGAEPKPAKPPTFSGERGGLDVETWLFQIELYLEATPLTEQKKVNFAAQMLRDLAATWYRYQQVNGRAFTTFQQFSTALKDQFKPVNAVKQARDQLASLRQTRSVQEYAGKFQALAMQIPGISADEQLDRFVRGLKENAQRELELHPVTTVEAAIRVAERVDAFDYRNKSTRRLPAFGSFPRQTEAVPMELGAMVQRKRLTDAERDKLRLEGKCFYCRNGGHIALNCPERPQRTPRLNGQRQ